MSHDFLKELGIEGEVSGVTDGVEIRKNPGGPVLESLDPATGEVIGRVRQGEADD